MPLPPSFAAKYGPWAVVTGASSGIGLEFARQLAAAGLSVVLTARRVDRLEKLASDIRENYPVQTKVIAADLSKEDGYQAVVAGTADLDVGLLINNAGMGSGGSFFREDLDKHVRLIAVNVTSVMTLTYAFGKRLASRSKAGKGGAILFVSSMMSDAAPWCVPYCSSKAFVSTFALSLREELAKVGVDVTLLEPGFVKSEMSDAATEQLDVSKLGAKMMPAEECARIALAGMAKGEARTVPGFLNRVYRFVVGFMPEGMRIKWMGNMYGGAFLDQDMLTFDA